MIRLIIEVMCMITFQYATSALLALPYDQCLVSIHFPDVLVTVVGVHIYTYAVDSMLNDCRSKVTTLKNHHKISELKIIPNDFN